MNSIDHWTFLENGKPGECFSNSIHSNSHHSFTHTIRQDQPIESFVTAIQYQPSLKQYGFFIRDWRIL